MDCERGFVELYKRLEKAEHEETREAVEALEVRLRTLVECQESTDRRKEHLQRTQSLICQLNKLAYRATGTPFVDLCGTPCRRPASARLALSLRSILLVLVTVICLLGLSSSLAASKLVDNDQWQAVQEIDDRIGAEAMAPFYLSRVDPCSPSTLAQMELSKDLRIDLTEPDSLCTWHYVDKRSGQILAKDHWGYPSRGLAAYPLSSREYYDRDGNRIARDLFDSSSSDCFRQRAYFQEDQITLEVCFSEAGTPRAVELVDSLRSPIPPMVYWFFYR